MARSIQAQAPLDYQTEQAALERRRRMAEALSRDAVQPMPSGQMVGNIFVKPSWTQGLAKLLQGYNAGQELRNVDQQSQQAAQREGEARAREVSDVMGRFSGTTGYTQDGMTGGLDAQDMTRTGNFADPDGAVAAALSSTRPNVQNLGQVLFASNQATLGREDAQRARADMMTMQQAEAQRQLQAQQDWRAEQAAAARAAQADRDRERAADAADRQARDIAARREQARLVAGLRPGPQPQAPVAVMGPDGQPVYVSPAQAVGQRPASGANGPGNRPLPTAALKMIDDNLEAIGLAGAINADIGIISGQIERGELRLGPISNLTSSLRNNTGLSNEASQNFASLQATIEKIRNDTLRLNKGVQTEGDAVRALNELVTNIRDPGVVRRRLGELQAINERAMALREMQINNVRQNYGQAPIDTASVARQPAAVGLPRPGQITGQDQGQGPQPGQSVQITAPGRAPVLPPMDAIEAEIRRRQGQR